MLLFLGDPFVNLLFARDLFWLEFLVFLLQFLTREADFHLLRTGRMSSSNMDDSLTVIEKICENFYINLILEIYQDNLTDKKLLFVMLPLISD